MIRVDPVSSPESLKAENSLQLDAYKMQWRKSERFQVLEGSNTLLLNLGGEHTWGPGRGHGELAIPPKGQPGRTHNRTPPTQGTAFRQQPEWW